VEKFIQFCKKQYKMLIPLMVVFVLLITIYFLYREYKYDNFRNKQEVAVFQYFGGIKTDYTAIVTYNLKDVIIDVTSKDKKIEYDSTPIYHSKEDMVIFPKEMSIVFPLREGSQYKLYKYATYTYNEEDNLQMIKNGQDTGEYNYFFLYDGKGLFFFPDEVELKLNNKVYKKLGAMSYVSLVGGYTLIYYDKATDTSEVIELNGKNVSISSDKININVNEKYFMSFGKKMLLFEPYNLNTVFKTDWQVLYINDIIRRE